MQVEGLIDEDPRQLFMVLHGERIFRVSVPPCEPYADLSSITVISGGMPMRPGKPMKPKPRFT